MNCENDLKKTWTVIKTLLSKNDISLAVDSFLIDNIEVTDKAVIANKFNKFFTEIGPTLAANIGECQTSFKHFLRDSPSSSIGIALTSPEEIMSIAKELRSTHSCGLDDISPQLARPTLDFVSAPLAHIINCSIANGIVPNDLKVAKVIPIFKSGERNKLNNYRPISILPYFSKFFEKVMYQRLTTYFTARNTLSTNQYGFRSGHSTFMALLELQTKITEAMDNNLYSIGIFSTYQKHLIQ